MHKNHLKKGPASSVHHEYALLSRQVEAEPKVMPELMPFEGGATVSLGWGTSKPEPAGYRRPGWWKRTDLTGRLLPCLALGLVFVTAGAVLAWIGLNLEPAQESSWALYFILGFGLILAVGGIRIMLEPWGGRATNLPATAEPGAWRHDYAWRETVRTENGSGHKEGLAHQVKTFVFFPVAAGILIVLHVPLFLAPEELHAVDIVGSSLQISGPMLWLIMVAVFDLIVLAALGAMIYTLIQWLRFGRPRFRLLSLPARPGGPLQAELHFSRGVKASGNADIALHCIDASTSAEAAAGGRHPRALVSLYRETRQLMTAGHRVHRLRLAFDLPADVPTSSIRNQPRIIWRLIVRIPTRGFDYRGEFLVPVYA